MKKFYIVAYTLVVLLVGVILGQTALITTNAVGSKSCGTCSDGSVTCDLEIVSANLIQVSVYPPNKVISVSNNAADVKINIARK